ncbi:DUF4190 domain-containing protein [Candidatus Woesearchaeota archaeon]|nr:DUF4190 domain-containing protein [Candidatus Woesearchaeota archaeon]
MEKSRAQAVTSLVFGLLFWVPLLNIIFGLLAVFIGAISLANIKKEPEKYYGKGYAIAGIILGALPIVLSLIGIGLCAAGYRGICDSMGLGFLANLSNRNI